MAGRKPAPPLAAVVGATASGKTDLALALAARMPVEIIVADSRQAYRGMDVGTAKPDAAARGSVLHHLLDVVDPDESFTVADWVGEARELAQQIAARGRLTMIVGGTGLYVSALVDGHDYASQASSPEVRQRLAGELEAGGLEPLAERLRGLNPELAARTDRRNARRVLRALERIEAGGGGGAIPDAQAWAGRLAMIGLDRPRDVLYRRIDARARRMFEHGGLLDEVRSLLAAGYGPELRPMSGHGYAEAFRHLAGEWSLERAIEVTARRTRQYAKRQLTWFRRDPRMIWIRAGDRPADEPSVVDEAEHLLRAALG